jgi:hypothetical protein
MGNIISNLQIWLNNKEQRVNGDPSRNSRRNPSGVRSQELTIFHTETPEGTSLSSKEREKTQ